LGSLTSQAAAPFPSISQLLIAAFILSGLAAMGALLLGKDRVSLIVASVIAAPAILVLVLLVGNLLG
jgi:hypothetical protein